MNQQQEEANVEATLASAEHSRAHARLMTAQAALEQKTAKPNRPIRESDLG